MKRSPTGNLEATTRRRAREWAVQLLFQLDFNPAETLDPVFAAFWQEAQPESREAMDFTERLVRGTTENRADIDATLARYAQNWDVVRMGAVERAALRMAIYEMLHCTDIPPVVSINEAVDVAKYFSTTESGKFVNGILDRIRSTLDRPAREAVKKTPRRPKSRG